MQIEELLPKSEEERVALERHAATLPALALTAREVSDLEQVLVGGFAPLQGFMTQAQYQSVLRDMRLPGGELWPIPITLAVGQDTEAGREYALTDEYGNLLATMQAESVYEAGPLVEAQAVYGTTNPEHAGVAQVLERNATRYAGGRVRGIRLPARYDFAELRRTPRQLRERFKTIGATRVIAFQTRNPVHRAHYEIMTRAAAMYNAHLLLHPVVGHTKEGDIDYVSRVRAYKRLHERYLPQATLSLLELSMRMAGPREALWHALVRRNYGATHFIVGRDHAGPGADRTGASFYPPFAAQELVQKHEKELGLVVVAAPEFAYSASQQLYLPADDIAPEDRLTISGSKLRQMLRAGEPIPEWFSFAEVLEELGRAARLEQARRGAVVFFTGLSGAGKSTIAHAVQSMLAEQSDRQVTVLDGDVVRRHLSKGLGFSREDRDENIARIGFVAAEVARHGGIALCAAIAPYRAARDKNRARISKHAHYIEVHVATALATCMARDPKGLYKKALAGEVKGVTGIDDPYEAPKNPELVLDTTGVSTEQCAEQVLATLRERGLL